jgi:UDP-glucose 4-epimerase
VKLLITGALGHIGSRLIHDLRAGDYEEVVLLDNLATQRYCSLFNLPAGVPFRFVEADVTDGNLESLFKGIHAVIHLAAITDAARSFENVDAVERVNFIGTERVAEACLQNGCRLLFPSTTSVYGTQASVVSEDCPNEELKPQSPYADSKLRAEQLLQKLGNTHGLKSIICRFGTIFGTSPGMRFHTAINKFCWQASLGQPITVWRSGLYQKRPYLDLGDAVRAIEFILKRKIFDNLVYNVLSANATVNDIVEILRSDFPDLQVQYTDARIMNQLSYEVCSKKFEALGFRFHGNLPEGIKETITLLRGIVAGQHDRTCPKL